MELQKTVKAQAEAWGFPTSRVGGVLSPKSWRPEVQVALHVGRSFAAQILDEEPTVFPGGVALGEERTSHFSAEVLQIGHNFWRVASLLDTKYIL